MSNNWSVDDQAVFSLSVSVAVGRAPVRSCADPQLLGTDGSKREWLESRGRTGCTLYFTQGSAALHKR
jgi:hypothetical protein